MSSLPRHKRATITVSALERSESLTEAVMGTTHFTDEDIRDIVELGESLRRIQSRLLAEGRLAGTIKSNHE